MIDDASVWTAATVGTRTDFTHELDDAARAEVRSAASELDADGRDFGHVRRGAVPFRAAASVLDRVYEDIENGRGFAVLSGFPSAEMPYDAAMRAYVAVGAHLGDVAVQNYEGESLVDVKDDGVPYSHTSRGYRSNKPLPFHCDGADLVGLLCLAPGAAGGETILVSATAVHNALTRERPDVLPILERGFHHHRRGQHPPGENPLTDRRIPVFAYNGGQLHCCYNRNPIEWCEKEGLALDVDERDALDAFDAVCARPDMQVRFTLDGGEILFFNNFVVLHSRTEFDDDPAHRRHMVRLWLQDPRSKRMGLSLLDVYVPGTSRYQAAGAV